MRARSAACDMQTSPCRHSRRCAPAHFGDLPISPRDRHAGTPNWAMRRMRSRAICAAVSVRLSAVSPTARMSAHEYLCIGPALPALVSPIGTDAQPSAHGASNRGSASRHTSLLSRLPAPDPLACLSVLYCTYCLRKYCTSTTWTNNLGTSRYGCICNVRLTPFRSHVLYSPSRRSVLMASPGSAQSVSVSVAVSVCPSGYADTMLYD